MREKDRKNWRTRTAEAWEIIWENLETKANARVKEEGQKHSDQSGGPDRDPGKQRLAQLGVLPSGAGPQAQMSRVSVPCLSMK